jgi:hypothetical protein
MKKFGMLLMGLSILVVFSQTGCVSASKRQKRAEKAARLEKMKGWEYVRIERQVPHKDCVYKLQQACGEKNASKCYNWYKQEAKIYNCNTVVITEDVRSRGDKVDPFMGTFKGGQDISALADFYDCPNYR